jgi:serine/threonine protein kinase
VEGTPFGRYQLIELLGRGGMGEVWRAHDTTIDRVVALKVLPHFAQVPEFDRRFRREARAAARLDDPHVVPIYDVGEIDGWLYVTMRLIAGQDLQTVLNDGPLPPARAVHIIEQIASALHGHYHLTRNFTNGSPQQDLLYSVATDCLRTDDRCMSYFHAPSDFRPLMFSDGTWVSELEFDGKCPNPRRPDAPEVHRGVSVASTATESDHEAHRERSPGTDRETAQPARPSPNIHAHWRLGS